MTEYKYYQAIADLFRYPDSEFVRKAELISKIIKTQIPEAKNKIADFISQIEESGLKTQQEYYMRTFDVQAICYLDIGYLMFGEDYKRAQLLVNLQKEHKKTGVDCGSELADYLPNVLTLLSRTEDADFTQELGFIILLPAVRFMITKFRKTDNYYKLMLEIVLDILKRDFPGEGLKEYAFAEEVFTPEKEFLLSSPKINNCNLNCKPKRS